ncbi:DUF4931 domain-containing protein, partial [Bacillus sp. S1-R4H1-FB]|uniref:DUF4931 domain-containing protein n=1 Tax=Bacillus sp. S1-R4H1-FB TaxID=1973492 RepID=UPI00112465D7
MYTQQLYFINNIGNQKTECIRNSSAACPFCDREHLTDISAQQCPIIWLKNKFPTLKDTFQPVLVETDNCEEHIATYKEEHMRSLIRFSGKHGVDLQKTEEFTSVILYQNHGHLAGRSLLHANMQIIGSNYVNNLDNAKTEQLRE